jgi:hypothetical protein
VKKWSAIFLVLLYLLGATNACQVLKLPLLVTHFIKHKNESPYITLGSFFKMHYIDPQPFDADYDQDMQLPFKKTPDTFCRNMPYELTVPKIALKAPEIHPEFQPSFDVEITYILLASNIFQPPRA